MGLVIKICGLSSEETVDAALAAGADMVGFVFFAKSPRNIGLGGAAKLAARARGRAEIAALSVDMEEPGLDEIVAALRPDWLQLHGSESVDRVAAVRQAFGVRVLKALPVAAKGDLARVAGYAAVADRLLFDAKPPKDASRPGGNGARFDWGLLAGIDRSFPFMLSGGLDAGNIAEAIMIATPLGVDVSSGVEVAPGVKDPALIQAFVTAARRAEVAAERGRSEAAA